MSLDRDHLESSGSAGKPDLDPMLSAILLNLSREIGRPLGLLQSDIQTLVSEPTWTLNEAERSQAATMLSLCEEIDRLTRDHLGNADVGDC